MLLVIPILTTVFARVILEKEKTAPYHRNASFDWCQFTMAVLIQVDLFIKWTFTNKLCTFIKHYFV